VSLSLNERCWVESTPPEEAAGCVRRKRLSRVVIAAVFLAIIVVSL